MEITEIKSRLSILRVLENYGLKPNRHKQIKCPFHEDDKPSMKIYTDTNTFNCFGCGANGDVIEFIQKKENLNKHQALIKATGLVGSGHKTEPLKQPKNKAKENHIEILEKIFTYFQNGLKSGIAKKPKEYLQSRNINPELLELGYNSGQFHHRGKLNEQEQNACIAAGLLIPYKGSIPKAKGNTYSPFAKDCIIFPLKNKQNKITGIYGRSITNNKNSKHYYLKNRSGLYPNYPIQETTKLILTEAIIDAATLLQISEITKEFTILALYGTNGLTEEHKQAIKEPQNLQEIIFFFDGDKAGNDAIQKYQKELNELLPGVKLSAVETPENEDVNSLLVGHDAEIFTHLLESRTELFLLPETILSEKEQVSIPEALPEPPKAARKVKHQKPRVHHFYNR